MAPKPVPTSVINGYLLLCTCLAAPFLNARLCQLVSVILIVRFLMFAIQAAVTSDARRTFALGFLISALAYVCTVWKVDEFELRRDSSARLPTTALLTSMTVPLSSIYDTPTSSREAQLRHTAREKGAAFMILGQLLFMFIFGICGGYYACRLTRSSIPTTPNTPRR
jgi:uncharacterized membrane protein YcfT